MAGATGLGDEREEALRVIAGRLKSRQFKTLAGQRLRPTSDRLRETLFNVLGGEVVEAVFADCYAGSGGVGIEALSRGARWVYFLEKFQPAVRLLRANLSQLGVEGDFDILDLDVVVGLRRLEARDVKLDFIFLDPPYGVAEEYERTLAFLGKARVLAPGGTVIAEHHHKHALADRYGRLERTRTLRQGDSVLSFYRPGRQPSPR